MPVFRGLIALSVLIITIFALKGKNKLLSFLFTVTPGVLALAFVNSTSYITGLSIPYSAFNVISCSFLGIPGAAISLIPSLVVK